MRLLFVALGICMTIHSVDAQTVALRNVSYPNTALEVGNTVEVKLTGAAAFGTVTVVENGGPPYTFGTTDEFGNWSLTAVETAEYVGSYYQLWYVNDVQMTPDPATIYLPYRPVLPSFQVYSNFTGTSCSGQATVSAGCGAANNARHWIWSPISYWSTSSVSSSAVTTPAGNWNSVQNPSKLTLANSGAQYLDIWVYDSAFTGTLPARALSYGYDCFGPCYNRPDLCTGGCLNAAAVYYVDIQLDTTD